MEPSFIGYESEPVQIGQHMLSFIDEAKVPSRLHFVRSTLSAQNDMDEAASADVPVLDGRD